MPAINLDQYAILAHSERAVGDGSTDDRAALQKVFDAVGAAGGGTIAITKHHAISSALTVWANTTVIGTGKISAAANFSGTLENDSCYLLKNRLWSADVITDENIHIHGIKFDYRQTDLYGGGLHSISFRRSRNVSVGNCEFHKGEDATAFLGCDTTLVDNCKAYDFTNCAYDHWTSPTNAIVRDCYAETASSVQMVNFNPENTFGSSVGNVADGFKLINSKIKYKGASSCPMQIEPLVAGTAVTDVVVSGNTFDNSFLVLRGHVGNTRMSDNTFKNLKGKSGVYMTDQFGVRPYDLTVTGNTAAVIDIPEPYAVFVLKANRYTCVANTVGAGNFHAALDAYGGDGVQGLNNFATGRSGQKFIGVNSSGL